MTTKHCRFLVNKAITDIMLRIYVTREVDSSYGCDVSAILLIL